MTVEEIQTMVDALYSDDSFTLEAAIENMTDVIDHCRMNIDALRDDIQNRDQEEE